MFFYVHIDSDTRSKLDASLKYVFSLAIVMRNLVIGFRMNKIGKSSEVECDI